MTGQIIPFPKHAVSVRAHDDWTIQALRNIGVHEERLSPPNLRKFERMRQLLREAEPIQPMTPPAASLQAKVLEFPGSSETPFECRVRALVAVIEVAIGDPKNASERVLAAFSKQQGDEPVR